ncbi:MAG: hypothetical protein LUE92_11755 [Clostridiales bacterium]|nr:hypothetical protein [Clostridiales bacterium]
MLQRKNFSNFIELNMIEDSLGNRLFANTGAVDDFYLQVRGGKLQSDQNHGIYSPV